MKLSDFSTIRTGITLRNSLQTEKSGEVAIFQPKDYQNGVLNSPSLFIEAGEINNLQKHLLKNNEVLIVNKGMKLASFIYRDEYPMSLASGSFFVITCDESKCIPDYLEWFLNQPDTKSYLLRNSATTTIPSLNKSTLEKLEVKVPALRVQNKIVSFLKLIKQKQLTLNYLVLKTEEFKNSYIRELID